MKVRAQSCVISKSWLAGSEMRCLHTVTCTTRRTAHGRVTATTLPVSNYTAEPPHLRAGARLEFATHPDLLFRAETASRVQRVGATPPRGGGGGRSAGVGTPKSTAGQQRGTEKADQSHHSSSSSGTAGGVNRGGGGASPLTLTVSPSPDMMVPQPDLLTRQCV